MQGDGAVYTGTRKEWWWQMPARTAEIIDLQAHRRARESRSLQADPSLPMMASFPAMTWVPVWFVPVLFVGTTSLAG